jgi:hypothetical protein
MLPDRPGQERLVRLSHRETPAALEGLALPSRPAALEGLALPSRPADLAAPESLLAFSALRSRSALLTFLPFVAPRRPLLAFGARTRFGAGSK